MIRSLLLVAAVACASLESHEQNSNDAKQKRPVPAVDQRGTRQAPLVIARDSVERAMEANKRKEERTEDAATNTNNFAVAVVVALIALAQALMFLWQLGIMRRGLADSTKAANAAEKAAAATEASVEAMKSVAYNEQRGYVMYKQPAEVSDGNLTMIWSNFGKTPVKDIEAFVYVAKGTADTRGPLSTDAVAANRAKICLAPGADYWIRCRVPSQIARTARGSLGIEPVYYLHGRVEYTDAFGKHRQTDFRYWIDSSGHPQNCADGNDWS